MKPKKKSKYRVSEERESWFKEGVRAERRRVCKILRKFAQECADVPAGGKAYAWASTALSQAVRRILIREKGDPR